MLPSGNRLARTYTQVERRDFDVKSWPSHSLGLNPALHDLRYYQGLVQENRNYTSPGETKCIVLELIKDGGSNMHDFEDDESILDYLGASKDANGVILRVIYCWLEIVNQDRGASFRHVTSLSQEVAVRILTEFEVSPQFLPKLLGEPDYFAPAIFQLQSDWEDNPEPHFYCQHPRWNIHVSETPISVYMSHKPQQACTTYVVSCGTQERSAMREHSMERLKDWWASNTVKQSNKNLPSPYILHCLISQASLESAKQLFNELRHRLYDVLDAVDAYAKSDYSMRQNQRAVLEGATVKLHNVSQDIDSTMAGLDMATMIAENLLMALERSKSTLGVQYTVSQEQTAQAASYLARSHASQKRWLLSWKSRKDIAMNLVYNLVTQQDAASSNATALLAQADGNAMKAIAALTMVFLPATFMATFYGMSLMQKATWKSYWIVTSLLTLVVLLIWWIWIKFPIRKLRKGFKLRLRKFLRTLWYKKRNNVSTDDEEKAVSQGLVTTLSMTTTLQEISSKNGPPQILISGGLSASLKCAHFLDYVEKFQREWESLQDLTKKRGEGNLEGGKLLFLGIGERAYDEVELSFDGRSEYEEAVYVYYLWLDLSETNKKYSGR
ncbi:uncharacterized protein PV09_01308 [Verruconis gallopava]|uniref:Uncharacterized protein n=1 Tax=Verruconis gallopava TaxID=253628 RepID=A0A0D1Y008_9PEZI|nr:uncharacterized protein PV09_01308 [Verruconis gallopava]KIW08396.1 hypothetical protein PV09_01308 [Verruconis gallopava]